MPSTSSSSSWPECRSLRASLCAQIAGRGRGRRRVGAGQHARDRSYCMRCPDTTAVPISRSRHPRVLRSRKDEGNRQPEAVADETQCSAATTEVPNRLLRRGHGLKFRCGGSRRHATQLTRQRGHTLAVAIRTPRCSGKCRVSDDERKRDHRHHDQIAEIFPGRREFPNRVPIGTGELAMLAAKTLPAGSIASRAVNARPVDANTARSSPVAENLRMVSWNAPAVRHVHVAGAI
jgi:hypothetical protein